VTISGRHHRQRARSSELDTPCRTGRQPRGRSEFRRASNEVGMCERLSAGMRRQHRLRR
jgi:hypothetical protein